MNATDITLILKACKDVGQLRSLIIDEGIVDLEFFEMNRPLGQAEPPVATIEEKVPYPEVDREIMPLDKDMIQEIERTQMMIDEPGEYEQMLIDEHLRGNNGEGAKRSGA